MELTIKQTQAIDYLEDDETTELLFGGGAGGGKSALGCYWQLKRRLKHPGTRGLLGRSQLKTLKETTLKTFFEICAMQGLQAERDYFYNQTASLITFGNGSEIVLKDLFLYPSDPEFDSLGSLEITDAFIDECNQVTLKAWQIVKSRIRYKLDENGFIPKMMGSCNPTKNFVYFRFYDPHRKGELPENRKFVQALLQDNKHTSKHYKQSLLDLDEQSKQRLLYGNWDYDADPATLCDFDSISDLWTNSFVNPGDSFMSCDIALHGSDKFVIGLWNGLVLKKIFSVDKCDAPEVEKLIKEVADDNRVPRSNIVYDADGLGSFLRGYLSGAKPFVNGSRALNGENYLNLKTQCAYKLAELINTNKIFIKQANFKDVIAEEISQLKRFNIDKDGKKQITPKDHIKEILGRSPDYLDMMTMRMYFEIRKIKEVHTTTASLQELGL